MQKYSLGIQSFSELRKRNCVYVDKTEHIYKLIQGKTYFLSHPRRFGKSLLLSTLKYFFAGRQDLFEGLWIADKVNWEELKHPVLHFSFIQSDFHSLGFETYLHNHIQEQARIHQIELKSKGISELMYELITTLHKKHGKGVVFLIDEYDKPITEFLRKDLIHIAEENRELMRQFYSPLKDLDEHLRFVFITGVSKFSKVSIFSDLNQLKDITINAKYATLLGYTEEEIIYYFKSRIEEIAVYQELTYEKCFEKMRLWYNGYSWNKGKDKVYNPTSMLNFLEDGEYNNYWFETGTPTFLVDMLTHDFAYSLDNIEVSGERLGSYRLDNLDEITLLFQTGYLTIKAREDSIFTLGYPNTEVRDSMNNFLLAEYTHKHDLKPPVRDLYRALGRRDFERVIEILDSMFGEIPYQIFDAKQEKYYHAIIFLTFRLLGYYAQAEPSVGKGRIDAVVETEDAVFIFEFKVNGTVEDAMAQIHQNRYYQRYTASGKEIYLLGLVCRDKGIPEWKAEKYETA